MNQSLYYYCPCGSFFSYGSKTKHIKTKKHCNYLIEKNLCEMNIFYNLECIFDMDDKLYSVMTTHYN